MSLKARQQRLGAALREKQLPAFLITNLPDVCWLTGFTGSNAAVAVLATKRSVRLRLFTDGRYTTQAKEEVQAAPVTIARKSVAIEATTWLEKSGVTQCGFDSATVTVAGLEAMKGAVSTRLRRKFFQPTNGLVAKLREVKDAAEIDALRKAAALGCKLYEQLLSYIQPGMTETEVAAELEHQARLSGAEAMSFETIVASGIRSALPHGKASYKRLAAGEMVTLDFGVILGGYCSDMTRTVYLSKGKRLSPQATAQRRVFEAVLAAQEAAGAAVRAGVSAEEVDQAARSVLKAAGLEKEFSHSTGHGVGLEIHEGPRIGAKSKDKLVAGMVITIEPGAYLAGKFGVRIEDTVLVTETGCEVLTPSPKAWTEL